MPDTGTIRGRRLLAAALPAGYALAAALLLELTEPLPQDPAYHDFADGRPWLGVPHFADVASNAAILLAALAGLGAVALARVRPAGQARRAPCTFRTAAERQVWALFFGAVALTALASAYYHAAPDDVRLLLDRLPLALTTAALPVLLLAERSTPGRSGWAALSVWLLLGPLSALSWHLGTSAPGGDLRLYGLMQGGAVLAAVLLLAFLPRAYTLAWLYGAALALYGLARVCEHYDAAIFAAGGLLSGHTLKHLLSGLAVALLVLMLWRRRPEERAGGTPAA